MTSTPPSANATASRESLFDLLSSIKDPELPVVNIVELGIVRDIAVDGESVLVDVTPTYSGCPAMQVIEQDIVQALEADGFTNVKVRYVFSPPWTTDWLSERTKTKLREFGIAPPMGVGGPAGGVDDLVTLRRTRKTIPCPYCGSANTQEKSEFGSTACKAIHYCSSCHQPFDYFKDF